ncbi:MAG: winged helix-turn-helix domain-containing protein [Bacteroidaceae bacterium]|nr:winged helix-turn-helix domain-containing protein [Bacteroidaceae bacterium]
MTQLKLRKMTLHEAMVQVLQRVGHPMTTHELADEINKCRLYVRKDGLPLPYGQISLRAYNYPQYFKMEASVISLA